MGLVALSPIDTLFTPPGEGARKHGASHGLPGKFTDLLAALLGAAAGGPGEVSSDQTASQASIDRKASVEQLLALLAAGREKGGDKTTGMPAVAALLAALLHPGATPVDLSTLAERAEAPAGPDVAGAATEAATTVQAPAADAALAAGDALAEPAADAAPLAVDNARPTVSDLAAPPATADGTGPDGLATVPAAATATDSAVAQDATSDPASGMGVDTATSTVAAAAAAGETSTAPAAGQVDAPAHKEDRPHRVKAESGPDPAEPPATETIQQGVVRFVGNAQKGKHESEQDPPGLQDHEPGVPRASAQGIAHASDNSAVAQLRTPAPDTPPVDQVASPPPPAVQTPPVEQVAHAIIEKVQDGGGEAHLRLDPPDLGEITIHVKISGDHVRVDVHAERTETMQMLRDQSLDLTSLLHGRGLDLTDVYVGLGGRQAPDTRGDEGTNGRSRQGRTDEFANLLGIDEEAPVGDRFNRLRSAYNPDGTHVYRI